MALILVAEDANFSRTILRRTLHQEGHTVLEATNGVQCLEILSSKKPDCLILDLLMPEMDGYQVLKALGERGLKVPTIIVTADIQATTRQHCLELGALAVLNKPPKIEELRSLLQQIFARSNSP